MSRGAKPGERRGGRQKGTPNRRTLATVGYVDVITQIDPLEFLADVINDDVSRIRPKIVTLDGSLIELPSFTFEQRMKAAVELAQYKHAKRKAIEHSGPEGGPIEHSTIDLSPREAQIISQALDEEC
ncbi:hypothetical protein JL101_035360 (plasmid) [Skermanella rosea]|uniref:hypothetical protein n=1 Tax=Skermanella rosea TaxID=1817965 RepID=UPI001933AAF6|nr:hypothetical protein [Skermanella rosea]UEM08077.1 hypothetical protein JL101_035360 [Skermanella rosea]